MVFTCFYIPDRFSVASQGTAQPSSVDARAPGVRVAWSGSCSAPTVGQQFKGLGSKLGS